MTERQFVVNNIKVRNSGIPDGMSLFVLLRFFFLSFWWIIRDVALASNASLRTAQRNRFLRLDSACIAKGVAPSESPETLKRATSTATPSPRFLHEFVGTPKTRNFLFSVSLVSSAVRTA